MAGYAFTSTGSAHAVLWNGTTATDLGTLGGGNSVATAINNVGQVVGYATIGTNNDYRATLWNGATPTDLNSYLDTSAVLDGWVLTDARGINDNGWIVGDAYNTKSGAQHAFLLSVNNVPEPKTYILMLTGVLLIGWKSRSSMLIHPLV